MNTTINDIARLAGVAKSTVSRYWNGGNVNVKTKARIRKVIEETNYEPNSFAQSLKAKKTILLAELLAVQADSIPVFPKEESKGIRIFVNGKLSCSYEKYELAQGISF